MNSNTASGSSSINPWKSYFPTLVSSDPNVIKNGWKTWSVKVQDNKESFFELPIVKEVLERLIRENPSLNRFTMDKLLKSPNYLSVISEHLGVNANEVQQVRDFNELIMFHKKNHVPIAPVLELAQVYSEEFNIDCRLCKYVGDAIYVDLYNRPRQDPV